MQIRATLAAALLLLPLLASGLRADVVQVEVEEAAVRMKDPKALDRADAYCRDKAIGAACVIPGNAFEGGGKGKCERRIDQREFTIDLLCTLAARRAIDRGLPSKPYRIDASVCLAMADDPQRETLASQGFVCEAVPMVADRFCTGLAAEAACMAEMAVAGESERHAGVCRVRQESVRFYFNGRFEAVRDVLQCEPAKPTPEPEIKPISLWRKLFG